VGSEFVLYKITNGCDSSKVEMNLWFNFSPIYASEFGITVVAQLACIDGSIPPLFKDNNIGISSI
jgi:hypothetical protein